MKDIVIPYVRNSSGELDACIQLINKHVPHKDIYLVQLSTGSRISHIDQILKLKYALETFDLTDEFYLYNDDFFVMEPIKDTPYFYKGTLADHLATRKTRDTYTKAIQSTIDLLGGNTYSYEMHLPFRFNKHKLARMINDVLPYINNGKCPLIRSMYGNTYHVGGTLVQDVKNVDHPEGLVYLSTTEHSFKGKLGDYIRSKL